LGFLEIDEEGLVSISADLEAENPSESDEDGGDAEEDDGAEVEAQALPFESDDGGAPQHPLPDGASAAHVATTGLTVDMDISMDVTEMGPDEIREKLEAINGALAHE